MYETERETDDEILTALTKGTIVEKYWYWARENEAREHIPVPYDNLFQSILSFAPLCESYI